MSSSNCVYSACVFLKGFFFQAKLKKIKEKYGEQDEEERQIKMEILAVITNLFCYMKFGDIEWFLLECRLVYQSSRAQ